MKLGKYSGILLSSSAIVGVLTWIAYMLFGENINGYMNPSYVGLAFIFLVGPILSYKYIAAYEKSKSKAGWLSFLMLSIAFVLAYAIPANWGQTIYMYKSGLIDKYSRWIGYERDIAMYWQMWIVSAIAVLVMIVMHIIVCAIASKKQPQE
ncbi:MAG: hypothetical protein LBS03_09240 [Bacteroidales bacterium]|jgi:hypothetical protein|nr:hypothetical protein [Bacteroidales bacterium]